MEDVIYTELERFRFSAMEARVYVCLVQHGQLNGSQIAKHLSASRSSVYSALQNLYERGAVYMLSGDPTSYKAEDYVKLLDQLEQDFSQAISTLRTELARKQSLELDDQYWNVEGFDTCIQKAKDILATTNHEVLLHTNLDFTYFAQSLKEALARGVRVIIFSFVPVEESLIPGSEIYFDDKFGLTPSKDKRLMIVSDFSQALIAGGSLEASFLGTFSRNTLLVSIVAEHIHHDIYLYKLEQKLGKNLVDESIQIRSMLEIGFEQWLERAKKPKIST
jgi:sugar-specific transcriptional regulator TrmB